MWELCGLNFVSDEVGPSSGALLNPLPSVLPAHGTRPALFWCHSFYVVNDELQGDM